jgi:hypothetical protein
VAKENNRGSINIAQKAGRTAKSAPKLHGKGNWKGEGKQAKVVVTEDDGDAGEPALVSKPRGKPGPKLRGKLGPKPHGKPGPKPSTKRKRTETEVETPSPQKLRKRA